MSTKLKICFFTGFLLLVAAITLALYTVQQRATLPPKISVYTQSGDFSKTLNSSDSIQIKLEHGGNFLEKADVCLTVADYRLKYTVKHEFNSKTNEWLFTIPLQELGSAANSLDGKPAEANLNVRVNDCPAFFFRNAAEHELNMSFWVDLVAPRVTQLAHSSALVKGGSASVRFTVLEELEEASIKANEQNFYAYKTLAKPNGNIEYTALLTLPHNAPLKDWQASIHLRDKAGNHTETPLPFRLVDRKFRTDPIRLNKRFFSKKQNEFAAIVKKALGLELQDPLELFLKVNTDVRAINLQTIRALANNTAASPLFEQTFLLLPNAVMRSEFADNRNYYTDGKQIDNKTHMGLDLASVVHDKIPAAANGKVVYSGDLGLYGLVVIIDHGLGLQTLYSHMSNILVKTGDAVLRGATIGKTGATGMAAGDHLHFEVLVNGLSVDPLEWANEQWFSTNMKAITVNK